MPSNKDKPIIITDVSNKTFKKANYEFPYDRLSSYKETDKNGKTVELPVLTEDDLKKADPLLKTILGLPKYRKIIDTLRTVAEHPKSGIINVTTGKDTATPALIEGIIKSAFPPGSNKLFKGRTGGYGVDASTWGDKGHSRLKQYLSGNNAFIDEKNYPGQLAVIKNGVLPVVGNTTLDFCNKDDRTLLKEVVDGGKKESEFLSEVVAQVRAKDEAIKRKIDEMPAGRKPTYSPVADLIRTGEQAMLWLRNKTRDSFNKKLQRMHGGWADASTLFKLPPLQAPGGGGGGTRPPSPVGGGGGEVPNLYKQTLETMEKIEELKQEKADFISKGKKKISNQKQRDAFNSEVARINTEIMMTRATMPQYTDEFQRPMIDRTGFTYHEPYDFGRLKKFLLTLPMYRQHREAYEKLSPGSDESKYRASYISTIDKNLRSCKQSFEEEDIKGEAEKRLTDIMKFVGFESGKDPLARFNDIMANRLEFASMIKKLTTAMDRMQSDESVLLIYGADNSSLLKRKEKPDDKPTISKASSLLDFSNGRLRRDKVIVFVTEQRVNFEGFRTAEQIDYVKLDQPVDEEEAMQLIKLVMREMIKTLESHNIENAAGLMAFENKDYNAISNVIAGRSHTEARGLLKIAFRDQLEKVQQGQISEINGAKIGHSIRDYKNKEIIEGGDPNGLEMAKAGLDFEDYIYDEDTAWGGQIDEWMRKFEIIENKCKRQDILEKKIDEISGNPDKTEERQRLSSLVVKLRRDIESEYSAIPSFMLLRGAAGVGKSVFVQAFANRLKFAYGKVEMTKAVSKWAGEREQFQYNFIECLMGLHDTVLLWDEIDKQIYGDESAAINGHENRANSILLSKFEEDDFLDALKSHHVFIIGTANNPEKMNKAIQNRAEFFEVPPPYNAVNYTKYLNKAMPIIKRHRKNPPFAGESESAEDAWKKVQEMIQSIDLTKVGQAFEGRGVNFRKMEPWLMKAIDAAKDYVYSVTYKDMYVACLPDTRGYPTNAEAFARFEDEYPNYVAVDNQGVKRITQEPKLYGFPWTLDNIVWAASATLGKDGEQKEGQIEASENLSGLAINGVDVVRKAWQDKGFAYQGRNQKTNEVQTTLFDVKQDEKGNEKVVDQWNETPGSATKATPKPDIFDEDIFTETTTPSESVPIQPAAPVASAPATTKIPPKASSVTTSTDYYIEALKKSGLLKG